jgi:hypothetical protein
MTTFIGIELDEDDLAVAAETASSVLNVELIQHEEMKHLQVARSLRWSSRAVSIPGKSSCADNFAAGDGRAPRNAAVGRAVLIAPRRHPFAIEPVPKRLVGLR